MKSYFDSLIVEQINRAHALKELIQTPVKFAELGALHERCTALLNDQIENLSYLREELSTRDESDLRDIFRDVRLSAREISLVEYYGIPALYYLTKEAGFLNKLAFKINQEIKLPIPPPAICYVSTEYYRSSIFTNVIFTPMGESRFLLHLPDIYHEIGHCVLGNAESESKLKAIKDAYTAAFLKVTDFYNKILREKRRANGPQDLMFVISRIHSHWEMWLIEFFCDVFALYTSGPAYAWAHLHLTVKKSDNIHELSIVAQSHPSDEARMRLLLIGLRNLGFADEAEKIRQRWLRVSTFWGNPQSEYQYAYPNELLEQIALLFFTGMKDSAFSLFTPEMLRDQNPNEVRKLLNKAWLQFWGKSPEEYRDWEEKGLQGLHKSLYEMIEA